MNWWKYPGTGAWSFPDLTAAEIYHFLRSYDVARRDLEAAAAENAIAATYFAELSNIQTMSELDPDHLDAVQSTHNQHAVALKQVSARMGRTDL